MLPISCEKSEQVLTDRSKSREGRSFEGICNWAGLKNYFRKGFVPKVMDKARFLKACGQVVLSVGQYFIGLKLREIFRFVLNVMHICACLGVGD